MGADDQDASETERLARAPRFGSDRARRPATPDDLAPIDGLIELTALDLSDVILDGSGATTVDITHCAIRGLRFEHVDAVNVTIASSTIDRCDLSRLSIDVIRQSKITDSKLVGTDLADGLLQDSVFERCTMQLTNLRMATVRRVEFEASVMTGVDFHRATLKDLSFAESRLTQCNVDGVEAERVDLRLAESIELTGASRLDGFTICHAQLPDLAHGLALLAGLEVED